MRLRDRLFPSTPAPVPLTLFTRRECPLCDTLRRDLAALGLDEQYTLNIVDVDTERELQDRYGWRVPVLELAGELLCEGRLEPAAFRRRFARSAATYWSSATDQDSATGQPDQKTFPSGNTPRADS